jgi:flagellar biosynthesis protein FlhA
VSLVQEQSGGHLMEKLGMLRKQAGLELGILMPSVRTRDNAGLPANAYVIRFRGTEVARGEVLPRFFLAVDTGRTSGPVDGIDTIDPSFGMPAKWIAGNRRSDAESLGYVVVDATTVITTHLLEALKAHASEVLGRQDVQEILDTLKKTHPALVEEVVPAKLSLGVVHRVLQRLLRERVPIRDLVTILEAVGDAADSTKDPELLTEHARRALGPVIARQFVDDGGTVHAITVGPRLEHALASLFSPRPGQAVTPLGPDVLPTLIGQLADLSTRHGAAGRPAPVIVPSGLRLHMRRMLDPVFPQVPVLSLSELPPSIEISKVASWEMGPQSVAA